MLKPHDTGTEPISTAILDWQAATTHCFGQSLIGRMREVFLNATQFRNLVPVHALALIVFRAIGANTVHVPFCHRLQGA